MLNNPLNGINGKNYAELLDLAERREKCDFRLGRIAAAYARHIAELPMRFLHRSFSGPGFRNEGEGPEPFLPQQLIRGQALSKTSADLRKVLRLFAITIHRDSGEGMELFKTFRKRWGVAVAFQ